MSNETPTDALRLVNPHKDITENLRQAAIDLHPWFVGDAKTFSVDCALPAYLNDAADEIERLRAATPASPLPEGGVEALISELEEARGLLEEVEPLAICWATHYASGRGFEQHPQHKDLNANIRAFLARNGKGEG